MEKFSTDGKVEDDSTLTITIRKFDKIGQHFISAAHSYIGNGCSRIQQSHID